MRAFHANWVWVAVVATGVVGLWGLVVAMTRRRVDRAFRVARGAAFIAMGIQAGAGLVLWGRGDRPGNEFHVFYGVVILVTFSLAYVYRAQLERNPALGYGLLLLFVMGLGMRAWANVA